MKQHISSHFLNARVIQKGPEYNYLKHPPNVIVSYLWIFLYVFVIN